MPDETSHFLPPIDLVREPDLILGDLLVSPSAREITYGGVRGTLEPRVMQVFVTLLQGQGRVVSRDELIHRCWEGRIVGEDAINRAIGRIRRLSEADGEASFALETIPRLGYRLILNAPLRKAAPAENSPHLAGSFAGVRLDSSGPLGRKPPTRRVFAAALLALGALAIIGFAAWLLWPEQQWSVQSSRPFISSLALEDYPAFSPDGTQLAYSSGDDGQPRQIFVRNMAGGGAVKITGDSYDDISPVWSADGAHIAYVARKAGEPCRIMVATVPAGQSREAGHCQYASSTTITWQPGTSFVYFSERRGLTGDAIFRLDLDSGAMTSIVTETRLNKIIYGLAASPDGRSIAYLVRGSGIVVHDLTSGADRHVGTIERHSTENGWIAWGTDSKSIFASISSGTGSEISVFPLNGGGRFYTIYTTPLRIGRLAAAQGKLALETDISRVNLARMRDAPNATPDIIDSANGYSWSPSFAPDGTLAFLSNRSGSNAVWTMKPGAAPVLLYDGGAAPLYKVVFSPDGARLALVAETFATVNIKVLTPSGASVMRFDMPSLGLGMPSWTQDSRALLVFDSHDKRIWRINADDPKSRAPFAPPHWVGISSRPQGTYATRADKPGIWRIDGGIRQLTAKYPAFFNPALAFRGNDVLLPDFVQAGTPRILAQPLVGGADRVLGYVPGAINEPDFQTGFAVDPRDDAVIYNATVGRDTNIDLLTLIKH